MNDVILARAVHVLAVVIWIGGVSMVTTVLLPALRRGDLGQDRLASFRAIQARFARQAKAALAVVGLSGVYMVARLDLWNQFETARFWWMHAMVCVWLLFAFMLFLAGPLVLHRRFPRWAATRPDIAFAWMNRIHWVLLILSLLTVFGVVSGSRGWSLF